MAGSIGIKIANGDFYPIVEENSAVKKRLVLTTVHDRQESVQIDLFRSAMSSMLDAQYIGSLVVEDIKPRPKGEPSIEMVISSDENGIITAEASDLDTHGGEPSVLNVSLKTLDVVSHEENFPDFDIEHAAHTPANLYNNPVKPIREEERKFPWLIMACATVFVVVVIALLWFFFLGGKDIVPLAGKKPSQEQTMTQEPLSPSEPVVAAKPVEPPPPPPPPSPPEPVEVIQQPVVPEPLPEPPPPEPVPPKEPSSPKEPVVIKAPEAPPPARPQTVEKRTRPPAPVASYKVPAVIPRNGAAYRIRWGDTLWDISDAFYRNPWLYPRIARFNNIKDPDLIISGRTIRIPPKN